MLITVVNTDTSRDRLGVHACDLPVPEPDTDPEAVETITEECRVALERDGSDAVVLGRAGMSELCAELTVELGVPVVDGIRARGFGAS